MAALAIPIVVLGSLYILSEQEKKNTEKQQIHDIKQDKKKFLSEGFNTLETASIFNKDDKKIILPNINSYDNNIHDDIRVTNSGLYDHLEKSITGEKIGASKFNHNNMQPFFGSKQRGITGDFNNNESILDIKQGVGSQSRSKSEQAPLFKPDENVNFISGTPNNTDFIQSRINESMKMSNVTLWEQERVAPGLNLGAGTEGMGGFNSGMMSRETWAPKTVDELRIKNDPKLEYDLIGHEGPLLSSIKSQGGIGKVEKHLPEKVFDNNPSRWFTTTGQEKNPPIRSTQVMPMENRIDTSREYYGNSVKAKANYTLSQSEDPKKIHLNSLPISNATATGQSLANPNDYSVNSYKILPNNRTTDKPGVEFGGVYGMAKAAVTPILDILNPTRKENAIGNLRETGNVNTGHYTGRLFNENDKTKVTNREMTTGKIDMNYVNLNANKFRENAYSVTSCQSNPNQRDTTNKQYIGSGVSKNEGIRTYDSAYNQRNNVNKTYLSRTNQGNMSLFNNENNMSINRNDNLLENNRSNIINGNVNLVPSSEFIGQMNGIQSYDQNFNNSRMDESLLNAFKSNPYTKSLSSVA
jgi:hypothetical protein